MDEGPSIGTHTCRCTIVHCAIAQGCHHRVAASTAAIAAGRLSVQTACHRTRWPLPNQHQKAHRTAIARVSLRAITCRAHRAGVQSHRHRSRPFIPLRTHGHVIKLCVCVCVCASAVHRQVRTVPPSCRTRHSDMLSLFLLHLEQASTRSRGCNRRVSKRPMDRGPHAHLPMEVGECAGSRECQPTSGVFHAHTHARAHAHARMHQHVTRSLYLVICMYQ